jgi:cytoskeletal protein CcmA (bactofilin family)
MFRTDKQGKEEQAGGKTTVNNSPVDGAALFGRSAGPESPPTAAAAAERRAVTESEALARQIKEGSLGGFVGSGTSINGETTFREMLRVDGHLAGRVHSADGTLVVGAGGLVEADIEVGVAIINGRVRGDITAGERIELGRAAAVIGDIDTPALVIEQGAIFEGSCRMTARRDAAGRQSEQAPVPGEVFVEGDAPVTPELV